MLMFRHSTQQVSALRAIKIYLALMDSGIVNGHQLMFDAHTVPEKHSEFAVLFLFYSLSSFSAVSFCVFVILTVLFLSWVSI